MQTHCLDCASLLPIFKPIPVILKFTSLNARGYMRGQRQAGAQGAVGIQLSRMREGTIQQTLDVEAVSVLSHQFFRYSFER